MTHKRSNFIRFVSYKICGSIINRVLKTKKKRLIWFRRIKLTFLFVCCWHILQIKRQGCKNMQCRTHFSTSSCECCNDRCLSRGRGCVCREMKISDQQDHPRNILFVWKISASLDENVKLRLDFVGKFSNM